MDKVSQFSKIKTEELPSGKAEEKVRREIPEVLSTKRRSGPVEDIHF